MPDQHTLGPIGELIALGATAITSAIAGVVGGTRVAKQKGEPDPHAETKVADAVHAEMQRIQREVLPGLVAAQIAAELSAIKSDLAILRATHGGTREELDRLRGDVAKAEDDGAKRWVEMARSIGSLEATIRNG